MQDCSTWHIQFNFMLKNPLSEPSNKELNLRLFMQDDYRLWILRENSKLHENLDLLQS